MIINNDILYPAIEEINETLDEGEQLVKSPETVLFGDGSLLDSIGLVNFIVTTERIVEEVTGKSVTLASEKAPAPKIFIKFFLDFFILSGIISSAE